MQNSAPPKKFGYELCGALSAYTRSHNITNTHTQQKKPTIMRKATGFAETPPALCLFTHHINVSPFIIRYRPRYRPVRPSKQTQAHAQHSTQAHTCQSSTLLLILLVNTSSPLSTSRRRQASRYVRPSRRQGYVCRNRSSNAHQIIHSLVCQIGPENYI